MSGLQQDRFCIEVGEFNGSLELLLDMIQRRKMHINDVSLSKVADEYINFVDSFSESNTKDIIDFIVIVSTLVLIKSKSLLPELDITEDEDISIKDLEYRLKRYEIYKEALNYLVKHIGVRNIFYKNKEIKIDDNVFAPPSNENLNTDVLFQIIDSLIKKNNRVNEEKKEAKILKKIDMKDVMNDLQTKLRIGMKRHFTDIVSNKDKEEFVVHFLALLELIKNQILIVDQDEDFGEITVERYN